MARTSRFPNVDYRGAGAGAAGDRLPIYLRGYAAIPPRPTQRQKGDNLPPSGWTLIFDTETTTDATQRLRIGTFQLLEPGGSELRGMFFDPANVTEEEVETLRHEAIRQ